MARVKSQESEQAAEDRPVSLVRMVRNPEYPEPHEADVHPDEVFNWRAGGWEMAEEAAE